VKFCKKKLSTQVIHTMCITFILSTYLLCSKEIIEKPVKNSFLIIHPGLYTFQQRYFGLFVKGFCV